MEKKIFLCAINNILSGTCREDCKFCTQSLHHSVEIERYGYKSVEKIVFEAKLAKKNGALGYCLVTAGKGLNDRSVEFVAKTSSAIKKEIKNLILIACNGIASTEQLSFLKKHGIDSYNHNLETSREYYKKICSTHSWEERYQTCLNVKSVGLQLCSGGILGMGETLKDRESFLNSIISLKPQSVPLNFYIPNTALPIKSRNINIKDALTFIKRTRKNLEDDTLLMVAGGREHLFNGYEKDMFHAGVNSIIIGDYLTTTGNRPSKDRIILKKLGYEIATECDFS